MFIYLLCLSTFVTTVFSSDKNIDFPLDDQLPMIARVNQPYSWTFSSNTFDLNGLGAGDVKYTTSALPDWISLNFLSRTFSGTPSAEDEGNPEITVTAHGSKASASSSFTLCVTSYPAPTLNYPLSQQFYSSNPSLSSVFLLSPGSAILTSNPTLRIPPRWSFSIGMEYNTTISKNDLLYDMRQADFSPLPDWMFFEPNDMTVNGVVPTAELLPPLVIIHCLLIASDKKGYSAVIMPFDIVPAEHELSIFGSLPTLNATESTPFNILLDSPLDFFGALVDGKPIESSNISSYTIDTTGQPWLHYNSSTRTLSGDPKDVTSSGRITLPAEIKTTFNQTCKTNVSIAIVPSYFSQSDLPPLTVLPGDQFRFNLEQYFSNATTVGQDVTKTDLTMMINPTCNWLTLTSNFLKGAVPQNALGENQATQTFAVTFTAYSRDTHSTSHASLLINVSPQDSINNKKQGFLSHPVLHKRLVLGLAITFGILGGLCLTGGILAAIRHCARVEDTALTGEEGRSAWTDKDRKWYGIGSSPDSKSSRCGPSRSPGISQPGAAVHFQSLFNAPPARPNLEYGHLGLGLRRVSERSQSETTQSPGVMSKREFITKIKETVRQVSDKYTRRQRRHGGRPVIGRPILVSSTKPNAPGELYHGSPSYPFEGPGLHSYPGSTIMTGSPSTSTAGQSIPRRRSDFAPPKRVPYAHLVNRQLGRELSPGSDHEEEAVVHTVSRAVSIKSARSGFTQESGSFVQALDVPPTRPRLVPFTSSTRVPVPQLSPTGRPDEPNMLGSVNRIASQSAKVFKMDSLDEEVAQDGFKSSRSGDELTMGIHYVRSLGADLPSAIGSEPGSPALSSKARSSFSSLETSVRAHGQTTGADTMRVLVRVGEKIKFRLPIATISESYKTNRKYEAKLTSGMPLPKFLRVDLNGIKDRGIVEFTGIAGVKDLGTIEVGVYAVTGGACMGKVIIEIAKKG